MEPSSRTPVETTSCGAIVWRVTSSVELCLIKQFKNSDSWGIAKGHIQDGETVEQCALREVKEETGLIVELGTKLTPIKNLIKNRELKTVIAFLARVVGDDKPRIDDPDCEVVDCRWFNIDALPKVHLYQRQLVDEAVRTLKTVLLSQQLADALTFVYGYASNIDEWGTLKKELLKVLPASARGSFSTRHPITKLHQTNDFERELASRWSKLTGRPVLFSKDVSQDPKTTT